MTDCCIFMFQCNIVTLGCSQISYNNNLVTPTDLWYSPKRMDLFIIDLEVTGFKKRHIIMHPSLMYSVKSSENIFIIINNYM